MSKKPLSRHLVCVYEYLRAIDHDVSSFIEAFLRKGGGLSAEEFSALWHRRKFARIFGNIDTAPDAIEFSERLLSITKKYFLPPNSMEVRTAAVFLLRAFFITQPVSRAAHVVLTLDEVAAVSEHVKWMMQNEKTDALIILASFVRLGGFTYALEPFPTEPEFYKEYRMEAGDADPVTDRVSKQIKEEQDVAVDIDEGPNEVNLKLKNEVESALKEFVHLSERYANVCKLLADRLGPDRAKMVFTLGTDQIRLPDLGTRVPGGDASRTENSEMKRDKRNGGAEEKGESILERRNRLRQKAFAGSSNSARNASPKPSTSSTR